MKMNEIIAKIGEGRLRAAMESDDAETLKRLFAEEGVEVSDEQLDYIAGGMSNNGFYGYSELSCLIPGQSCVG